MASQTAKKKPRRAAKAKRPRTRRPKQAVLPGTEDQFIAALEDATATYYDVMIDRCKLSKEEAEAKDNLIDKMKENACERYETADGLVVTLTAKANLRCKKKKDVEANGEADIPLEE